MPFEKKKKHKTSADYIQKSLYFEEEDLYQREMLALLKLCGHKQAKFLGLLAHDFINRNQINVDAMNKDLFANYMKLYEMQLNTGMNPLYMGNGYINPIQNPMYMNNAMMNMPEQKEKEIESNSDDFIREEDMEDMEDALNAFGI